MNSQVKKFTMDESGATAIEYALIVSATGLALVPAMPSLGGKLQEALLKLSAGL
jgi:Flp pilus assembly pilin Flp